MNGSITINRTVLSLVIPSLLFLGIILMIKSPIFPTDSDMVSLGITIDLLLTIPLIFYVLNRKTAIPNTTVLAIVAVGVVIGSVTLPKSNQFYLDFFKTWFIPVLELMVITYIVLKVKTSLKKYRDKDNTQLDVFTLLKEVCNSFLPSKLVYPIATEVAVFYYGFVSWKKKPLSHDEFTYHKQSSSIAILGALILMTIVETFALHILLVRWNPIVAWVLTGISIYTIFQIWGLIKSLSKRPVLLDKSQLILRYGLLNEANISLENIGHIEITERDLEGNKAIRALSPLDKLEGHNIIIHLKNECNVIGFYGIKKKCKSVALHLDDVELFKKRVNYFLHNN